MVRVLGTQAVLCGMQPSVALTLVEMGRELLGVSTALNLDRAMDMIELLSGPDQAALSGTEPMTESSALKIATAEDVVRARAHGRECARALGFGSADQTRLATAISELTRNALCYAGSGACSITDESDENLAVVSVIVEDEGPGISGHRQGHGGRFLDRRRPWRGSARGETAGEQFPHREPARTDQDRDHPDAAQSRHPALAVQARDGTVWEPEWCRSV